jgi:hypothetical protein
MSVGTCWASNQKSQMPFPSGFCFNVFQVQTYVAVPWVTGVFLEVADRIGFWPKNLILTN